MSNVAVSTKTGDTHQNGEYGPLALQMGTVTGAVDDLVHGYEQLVGALPSLSEQVQHMHHGTATLAKDLEGRTKSLVDGYEYLQGLSSQIPDLFLETAASHKKSLQDATHILSAQDKGLMKKQEKQLDKLKGELQSIAQERVIIDVLSRPVINETKRIHRNAVREKENAELNRQRRPWHSASRYTGNGEHPGAPFNSSAGLGPNHRPPTGHHPHDKIRRGADDKGWSAPGAGAGTGVGLGPGHVLGHTLTDEQLIKAPIVLPDYHLGDGLGGGKHSRYSSVKGHYSGRSDGEDPEGYMPGKLVARAVGAGSMMVPSMRHGTLPAELQHIKTSPSLSLSEAAKLQQEMYKRKRKKPRRKVVTPDWQPFAKKMMERWNATEEELAELRDRLKKAAELFGKEKEKSHRKLQRIAQAMEERHGEKDAALLAAVEKLLREALEPIQDANKDAELLKALQCLLLPEAALATSMPRTQYKVMTVGGAAADTRTPAPLPIEVPVYRPEPEPEPEQEPEPIVQEVVVQQQVLVPSEDYKEYADQLYERLRREVLEWLERASAAGAAGVPAPAPVGVDRDIQTEAPVDSGEQVTPPAPAVQSPQIQGPSMERELIEMMQKVFLAQQHTMQGNQALLLSLIHQQQHSDEEALSETPPEVQPLMASEPTPRPESPPPSPPPATRRERVTSMGQVLLEGEGLLRGPYALTAVVAPPGPQVAPLVLGAGRRSPTADPATHQQRGPTLAQVLETAAPPENPDGQAPTTSATTPARAVAASSSPEEDSAEWAAAHPMKRRVAALSTLRLVKGVDDNNHSPPADSATQPVPPPQISTTEDILNAVISAFRAVGTQQTQHQMGGEALARKVSEGVQMGVREALGFLNAVPPPSAVAQNPAPLLRVVEPGSEDTDPVPGPFRVGGGKHVNSAARSMSGGGRGGGGRGGEGVGFGAAQQRAASVSAGVVVPVGGRSKAGTTDNDIRREIDQSRAQARKLAHIDFNSSFDESCSLDEEAAAWLRDPLASHDSSSDGMNSGVRDNEAKRMREGVADASMLSVEEDNLLDHYIHRNVRGRSIPVLQRNADIKRAVELDLPHTHAQPLSSGQRYGAVVSSHIPVASRPKLGRPQRQEHRQYGHPSRMNEDVDEDFDPDNLPDSPTDRSMNIPFVPLVSRVLRQSATEGVLAEQHHYHDQSKHNDGHLEPTAAASAVAATAAALISAPCPSDIEGIRKPGSSSKRRPVKTAAYDSDPSDWSSMDSGLLTDDKDCTPATRHDRARARAVNSEATTDLPSAIYMGDGKSYEEKDHIGGDFADAAPLVRQRGVGHAPDHWNAAGAAASGAGAGAEAGLSDSVSSSEPSRSSSYSQQEGSGRGRGRGSGIPLLSRGSGSARRFQPSSNRALAGDAGRRTSSVDQLAAQMMIDSLAAASAPVGRQVTGQNSKRSHAKPRSRSRSRDSSFRPTLAAETSRDSVGVDAGEEHEATRARVGGAASAGLDTTIGSTGNGSGGERASRDSGSSGSTNSRSFSARRNHLGQGSLSSSGGSSYLDATGSTDSSVAAFGRGGRQQLLRVGGGGGGGASGGVGARTIGGGRSGRAISSSRGGIRTGSYAPSLLTPSQPRSWR